MAQKKPGETEGISRRTWYRRRAWHRCGTEQRDSEATGGRQTGATTQAACPLGSRADTEGAALTRWASSSLDGGCMPSAAMAWPS